MNPNELSRKISLYPKTEKIIKPQYFEKDECEVELPAHQNNNDQASNGKPNQNPRDFASKC